MAVLNNKKLVYARRPSTNFLYRASYSFVYFVPRAKLDKLSEPIRADMVKLGGAAAEAAKN